MWMKSVSFQRIFICSLTCLLLMKIYFAGSIRGGRDDKKFYNELIVYLETKGLVLTEHIGDLSLSPLGEEGMSDEQIYTRDIDWIKEADVLVADISTPSLGVGYELAFAESLHKKVLCLYREQDKLVSAMIAGNKNFLVKSYTSLDDAKQHIDAFFSSL